MVEVKNFHFLKRPFLTKKGKWFFVTLRGGRGGVRASMTFVTKKLVFFFEGFPKSHCTDCKKCFKEDAHKNDSSSVGGYNKREEAIIV